MIKHTTAEKEAHLINLIHSSQMGRNELQAHLKGSEWGMRRANIGKILENEVKTKPLQIIQNDKNMFPSTKAKLIKIINKNHKSGKGYKNVDMIRTIYNPSIINERYK